MLFSSCGSIGELLNENPNIIFLGASYEKDVIEVDEDGVKIEKSLLASAAETAKASMDSGKLTTKQENKAVTSYLREVKDAIAEAFVSNGYKIKHAKDYEDVEEFQDLANYKPSFFGISIETDLVDLSSKVVDKPYLNGDVTTYEVSDIADLLDETDMQLAFFVEVQLIKKYNSTLINGSTQQLGVKANIVLVDEDEVVHRNIELMYIEYLKPKSDGRLAAGLSGAVVGANMGGGVVSDLAAIGTATLVNNLLTQPDTKKEFEELKLKLAKQVDSRLKSYKIYQ